MTHPPKRRRRQMLGYAFGALVGAMCLLVLFLPGQEDFHVRGPMNTGHEGCECESCHKPAAGTLRQQLQANVRYLLGQRETLVPFGHEDVTTEICLKCHERPNDRHAVFRFFEPRFVKVRAALGPHLCTSCHREHAGQRVTVDDSGYCVNCHEETKLKKDPLDVSHEQLIAQDRWRTCLGCHDFHGNHVMKTATKLDQAFPPEKIRAYFQGGPSPYPEKRQYTAKKEGCDD
ncbi:MAG: cytochrome c3 family protein [Gammaproteobacteria bacterium]